MYFNSEVGVRMKNLEHNIQSAFIEWCRLNEKKYPELSTIYAVPNGEYRPIAVAKRLKAEGVRAGVPDICLPVGKPIWIGRYDRIYFNALYIEFKAPKGRLSKVQRIVGHNLAVYGNLVVVAWGFEAARDAVISYLAGEMPKFEDKRLERVK